MVCFMGFLHRDDIPRLWWQAVDRIWLAPDVLFSWNLHYWHCNGKHVKRTRYAYQLTLALLNVLKVQVMVMGCMSPWRCGRCGRCGRSGSSAMCQQKTTGCQWESICSSTAASSGVSDWVIWLLTLNACDEICPWFFYFGHTNYACRVPVFLRDMARLPETHPSVHETFMAGKYVVQRSDKKSSLMALDQSQDHSIQFLKEDSGAKGLYGQQESKEVTKLSKPEVQRAIDEFECACFSALTPTKVWSIQCHELANRKSSSNTWMLYVILWRRRP